MSRLASLLCASAERRAPMANRDSTHAGLCPSSRAMAPGVILSSSLSERTTFASSSAVTVRGGALASSSSRLCSAAEAGRSTTTGTEVAPRSRQRERRLKPSRTSKPPSESATTRRGSSASNSGPGPSLGRSFEKVVRSRSSGTDCTALVCSADMTLLSRRSAAAPSQAVARQLSQKGVAPASTDGRWATTRRRSSPRHSSCSTFTRKRRPCSAPGEMSSPGRGISPQAR